MSEIPTVINDSQSSDNDELISQNINPSSFNILDNSNTNTLCLLSHSDISSSEEKEELEEEHHAITDKITLSNPNKKNDNSIMEMISNKKKDSTLSTKYNTVPTTRTQKFDLNYKPSKLKQVDIPSTFDNNLLNKINKINKFQNDQIKQNTKQKDISVHTNNTNFKFNFISNIFLNPPSLNLSSLFYDDHSFNIFIENCIPLLKSDYDHIFNEIHVESNADYNASIIPNIMVLLKLYYTTIAKKPDIALLVKLLFLLSMDEHYNTGQYINPVKYNDFFIRNQILSHINNIWKLIDQHIESAQTLALSQLKSWQMYLICNHFPEFKAIFYGKMFKNDEFFLNFLLFDLLHKELWIDLLYYTITFLPTVSDIKSSSNVLKTELYQYTGYSITNNVEISILKQYINLYINTPK
ncbi:uncharacterized protein SCDLUD_002296 [Saccharomycodes ludwigii]|uniref:uncharacterized protein n=1 Tax=Saccharomycodes ludwigii TaxID=36035 RepID=UPI001E878E03|nr:hypothetical protein SCDLUD_002296 [Saccharomycodes ludwigii]KAH3900842.1 hypothetical protein SCDLUD_002296 [Saccharomycodes ludwigii]